jgi:hypothetical protein
MAELAFRRANLSKTSSSDFYRIEMSALPKNRKLAPTFDSKGNPEWRSVTSPPDPTVAVVSMISDRIIPIVFVPGVMGSNLKGIGPAKGYLWRLDSSGSMAGWLMRDARIRKAVLTPTTMVVDDEGLLPEGTKQPKEELKRRGWGEVGAMSYASFLVWLENAMNDHHAAEGGERDQLLEVALGAVKGEVPLSKTEVALSYKYRFPVHAFGYNWLDDNGSAALLLRKRIDEIITRYRNERRLCEKVIVVTHSMGGLVARHCSEVLGMSEKILGIVHGVMPAIGAAAVYRRFKAGTEGDKVPAMVLGSNAAEMTAVLSSAPGPLQLLPTPEYGNHWLRIREGKNCKTFPTKSDPYGEIYTVRDKWWSMCDQLLINPLHDKRDSKYEQRVDGEWQSFVLTIFKKVKPFHSAIQGKYHSNTYAFFGSHPDHKAYGTVSWDGRDDTSGDFFIGRERNVDMLNARLLHSDELKTGRNVASPLEGNGWKKSQRQFFSISEPEEDGDGTVPHRSGVSPGNHASVQSLLKVSVGHEPAFKDSLLARRFTLRAIVKIAQEVAKTSLTYEGGK